MSTKIYDAYRVENDDIAYTYEFLNKIGTDYTNAVKNFLLGIRPKELKSYSDFSDLFDELDFEASIVVYLHKGKIYIQLFDNRYIHLDKLPTLKELIDSNQIIDYHYQNQSDPWFYYDETIDESKYEELEAEHEERGVIWDEIFEIHSSPSKVGLIKEFKPNCIDLELYQIYTELKKHEKEVQDPVST